MKQLLAVALLFNSLAIMAKEVPEHIRAYTLQKKNLIEPAVLDQVGAKFTNRKTKETLIASCEARNINNDCEKIFFVLQTNNRSYIVHKQEQQKISVDLTSLQSKKELSEYKAEIKNAYDLYVDRSSNMLDQHFYLTIRSFAAGKTKSPLYFLLIPFAIPVDYAMTSMHYAYDLTLNSNARKIQRYTLKMLQTPSEDRILSNKAFNKLFYSLSTRE